MKFVEVARCIDASPSTVWSYLSDPQALVDADTGLERIDGQFTKGKRFVLRAALIPRDFKITVSELIQDRLMVWESGMPLGLFKGVRRFSLEASGTSTQFHMREEFTGLMLSVIWKSMPDLQPSFDQFADALKQLSENTKNDQDYVR